MNYFKKMGTKVHLESQEDSEITTDTSQTEHTHVNSVACQINILGSEWKIKYGTSEQYPVLVFSDGYADSSVREIIICDLNEAYDECDHKRDLEAYRRHIVRHEVIHAFLMESGLDSSSLESTHWAENEEMVDWIAMQIPKIYKVFEELGVLE